MQLLLFLSAALTGAFPNLTSVGNKMLTKVHQANITQLEYLPPT